MSFGPAARLQHTLVSVLNLKEESRLAGLITLSLRVGMLVALYMAIEAAVGFVASLPQEAYAEPVLLIAAIRRWGWGALVALALVGIGLWHFRSLGPTWSDVENGRFLRPFLILVAAILTWTYAAYEYNLFFDQAHTADRLILIFLLLLFAWRPLFIVPWLLTLVTIMGQFHYPMGGYSVAEQFQLVRLLYLFTALMGLRWLTGHWHTNDFLFVLFCLLAAGYWWSGVGKLQLNWIGYGAHLHHLLFATYANGWLGFLAPETIAIIGRLISLAGWPMMAFTLFVEVGVISLLWKRPLLPLFLGSFILFHLGVFALSGIFFWKWIVVESALLVYLLGHGRFRTLPIFSTPHFLLSLFLIGGSVIWFKPVKLAWYDARINYVYRFLATGTSGQQYTLPPSFFRPYDYQFTLSPFGFLTDEPQLQVVWGATHHRAAAEALLAAHTAGDVFAVEAEWGANGFDPTQTEKLDHFLTRFLGNWNGRRSQRTSFSRLQPMPQLWTFAAEDAFAGQEPIAAVTVYQVTSFYDGDGNYQEIRSRPVHHTNIPVATP